MLNRLQLDQILFLDIETVPETENFSDLSEVCWILGLEGIHDTQEFFNRYAN